MTSHKVRTWVCEEYDGDHGPLIIRKTDAQILAEYFPRWKAKMLKANKGHLISENNCIADWVTVHWAYKEK